MEDVSKIFQSDPIHPDKQDISAHGEKRKKKKKHREEAKKHFDELTQIVEQTHQELEAKNSPFRLCIYQEDDDIYIDIVAIDDAGKISQVFKHDISHSELENLVQHIKSGRGLILDADV